MSERRVALVTGGRRGIGAAIAERLAADGCAVAVHHLGEPSDAARVVERCLALGAADAYPVDADLADPAAAAALVETVRERSASLDILVNAAVFPRRGWEETTLDEWEDALHVMLTAPFVLSQAALPGMRDRGWGRIVNVTSVTVRLGRRGGAPYISAKAVLVGLTRTLSVEVGTLGVTVNAVSPGAIRTEEETRRHDPSGQAAVDAEILALQAVPRRLVAADVAGAVAYLASDEAGAVTGQVLEVNGGWGARHDAREPLRPPRSGATGLRLRY